MGWEANRAYRWAIEHDGRLYPVKQIAALASGLSASAFSGGEALNTRLARLSFTIVALQPASEPPEPAASLWPPSAPAAPPLAPPPPPEPPDPAPPPDPPGQGRQPLRLDQQRLAQGQDDVGFDQRTMLRKIAQ